MLGRCRATACHLALRLPAEALAPPPAWKLQAPNPDHVPEARLSRTSPVLRCHDNHLLGTLFPGPGPNSPAWARAGLQGSDIFLSHSHVSFQTPDFSFPSRPQGRTTTPRLLSGQAPRGTAPTTFPRQLCGSKDNASKRPFALGQQSPLSRSRKETPTPGGLCD